MATGKIKLKIEYIFLSEDINQIWSLQQFNETSFSFILFIWSHQNMCRRTFPHPHHQPFCNVERVIDQEICSHLLARWSIQLLHKVDYPDHIISFDLLSLSFLGWYICWPNKQRWLWVDLSCTVYNQYSWLYYAAWHAPWRLSNW